MGDDEVSAAWVPVNLILPTVFRSIPILVINIGVDFLSCAVEDWYPTAVLPVCK